MVISDFGETVLKDCGNLILCMLVLQPVFLFEVMFTSTTLVRNAGILTTFNYIYVMLETIVLLYLQTQSFVLLQQNDARPHVVSNVWISLQMYSYIFSLCSKRYQFIWKFCNLFLLTYFFDQSAKLTSIASIFRYEVFWSCLSKTVALSYNYVFLICLICLFILPLYSICRWCNRRPW